MGSTALEQPDERPVDEGVGSEESLHERCIHHPGRPAVARCSACEEPVCMTCAVPVRGRVLGPECLAAELGDPAITTPPEPDRTLVGSWMAVAGAALALFVGYKRPHQQPRVAVAWHALQIAALALVVISFALTALHFGAAPPALDDSTGQLTVPGVAGPADVAPVVRYIEALNVAQYALADALNGNTERVEGALEQLEQAPRLDDNGDRLREDLRALVVRARDSAGMTLPTKDAARRKQTVAAIIKDFHEWEVRQRQWLRNDARNHGFVLREPPPQSQPRPGESGGGENGGAANPPPTNERRK